MLEVEIEFLNQKHFDQRYHQDKKFYKKPNRCIPLFRSYPPVIYKQFNSDETCSDCYYKNILIQDRNIKKDPFGIDRKEYSLNKKKRWLIPQILGENIESYQNPELNLKVSLVTTNQHWRWNVTKYTGYSQIEQKTLTKTAKNARPDDLFKKPRASRSKKEQHNPSLENLNCAQRNKHKKFKKCEHDMSILYVTHTPMKEEYCINCREHLWFPPRPKPSFDKNDIYDYETCPMDDFLPFEENENIDPLIRTPTPTYRLEDFIVNKQEKEKRKKKISRKISDFEIFSKAELKEAILGEKRVSQETRENPETRCRIS